MSEQPNDLLAAVDALTKPQRVAFWRDTDNGQEIVRREDPPLLDWLRESIGSKIGGNGGGKAARGRAPIDLGALQLYENIDGQVRAWVSELGGKVGKGITPTQALRSWYVLYAAGRREWEDNYLRQLEGWAVQVKDKLDPPKKIEITSPCPACGAEFVNIGLKLADGSDDPNDVERVRALNAVERETMDESYVLCSACDRVWKGVPAMRSLRIWIDDKEQEKTA